MTIKEYKNIIEWCLMKNSLDMEINEIEKSLFHIALKEIAKKTREINI